MKKIIGYIKSLFVMLRTVKKINYTNNSVQTCFAINGDILQQNYSLDALMDIMLESDVCLEEVQRDLIYKNTGIYFSVNRVKKASKRKNLLMKDS